MFHRCAGAAGVKIFIEVASDVAKYDYLLFFKAQGN
jgi:hypothetical protein